MQATEIGLVKVRIDKIHPSPFQPRLNFDTSDLIEEIQKDGLLSPLLVRKTDGQFELIDGERRLRTLHELGWKDVPVEVRDINDEKARLSVYKLNTVRKEYSTEERARYFKKLSDEGMTAYKIGLSLNVDDNWVRAHLNLFKFPSDIQNAIWENQLSLAVIRELEPIIEANLEEAIRLAKQAYMQKLTHSEIRKLVSPRLQEIERARIEEAKKAIGATAPTRVKLETPEELERAAQTLRKEAQRKRMETLTDEDKTILEAQRLRREDETRKRVEEQQRRLDEEAAKRAKVLSNQERVRIERQAREKAVKEVLEDPKILRQAVEKAQEKGIVVTPTEGISPSLRTTVTPYKEMTVKEGISYIIGDYNCPKCRRHYVIKCDGKHDWIE